MSLTVHNDIAIDVLIELSRIEITLNQFSIGYSYVVLIELSRIEIG